MEDRARHSDDSYAASRVGQGPPAASEPPAVGEAFESALLEPGDRLYVPQRKRMTHAYVTSEAGARELLVYYGLKEITFDEERFFPFGEQLARQSSFIAESAASWGPGYEWPEIRSMLEALLAEGILKRGDPVEDLRGGGLVASRLPPSVCPVPRMWSAAECESITLDLGGRPVEVGHLEALLPVNRIAHPALDADDRQVGEANVWPIGLRLDRQTEWRVCQYPGSRFRDESPMNVTALKAMIKHWKPMMKAFLAVRSEVLKRFARSRDGWTISDLHTLACVALSLPAFQLMKGGGTSPQRPLHPVLSSLYRISDGIRMTTHRMMYSSEERTRAPEETTTAAEFYDFTERSGLFLTQHGVCAGPKALIDEFLAVVFSGGQVEGSENIDLAPEIEELLSQLPEVTDYTLLGLLSLTVSRSMWLQMSPAYKALGALLESAGGSAPICRRLRERVEGDWAKLIRSGIASEHAREVHLTAYADTYEHVWRALRTPVGPPTLVECIAACPAGPQHAAVAGQLREILESRLAGTPLGVAPALGELVDILIHYLREEQAILRSTAELQGAINAMLDRPRPRRPLTGRDLRVNQAMYGGAIAEFPYLFSSLEDELGVRVECTAGAIEVTTH